MIAKTTTGSDFTGALPYGAGQRRGREKEAGEASLLVVSNVIPGSPRQMAQEMQATASLSHKVLRPVWHTVLSWKEGEAVIQTQKVAAVRRYCELMGAPITRHQVVVYEHRDKKNAHVHIYLNRVPIDGGPALRTDNNFYRQPGIIRQISQELGLQPIPAHRRSLQDLDPKKEAARQLVRQILQPLLGHPDLVGEEWLAAQLQQQAVSVRFTHDKGGTLRGVSFELLGVKVKGQEVGCKAAQLREAFAQTRKLGALGLPKPDREVSQRLPVVTALRHLTTPRNLRKNETHQVALRLEYRVRW